MTEPPATPADEPVAFQAKRKEKFATIPTALVRDPTASPYVVATYVALDSRTDGKDTEVWPSWSLLAAESHQSMGRLSKSLQWLEERGWISVERRYDADGHRKVNKYTLYWSPNVLISPDEIRTDSTSEVPDSTGLILSGREEEDPSESEPQKKNHSGSRLRRQDLLWESFVSIHGQPATESERGKYNKAVSRLREANVTPDEYPTLVSAYTTKNGGLQGAPMTIAERVGELRHFIKRGPVVGVDLKDVIEKERRDRERAKARAIIEART